MRGGRGTADRAPRTGTRAAPFRSPDHAARTGRSYRVAARLLLLPSVFALACTRGCGRADRPAPSRSDPATATAPGAPAAAPPEAPAVTPAGLGLVDPFDDVAKREKTVVVAARVAAWSAGLANDTVTVADVEPLRLPSGFDPAWEAELRAPSFDLTVFPGWRRVAVRSTGGLLVEVTSGSERPTANPVFRPGRRLAFAVERQPSFVSRAVWSVVSVADESVIPSIRSGSPTPAVSAGVMARPAEPVFEDLLAAVATQPDPTAVVVGRVDGHVAVVDMRDRTPGDMLKISLTETLRIPESLEPHRTALMGTATFMFFRRGVTAVDAGGGIAYRVPAEGPAKSALFEPGREWVFAVKRTPGTHLCGESFCEWGIVAVADRSTLPAIRDAIDRDRAATDAATVELEAVRTRLLAALARRDAKTIAEIEGFARSKYVGECDAYGEYPPYESHFRLDDPESPFWTDLPAVLRGTRPTSERSTPRYDGVRGREPELQAVFASETGTAWFTFDETVRTWRLSDLHLRQLPPREAAMPSCEGH